MEIKIDDYNINYKITGTGEHTVVILQGWGTTMEVYDSVAACISSKYRVVQLDLPGFGTSTEPREPWAVEDFAVFFIKFMEKLEIKSATLIGHSYGGRMIIRMAIRDALSPTEKLPFTIEKIVLIDSAGILPKKSFKQKMRIRRYKVLKKIVNMKLAYAICPDLIDDWRSRQGSEDYRNATPMMRQCLVKAVNEDLTDLLSKITVDTLLIWGDADTATPLADGQLMEKLIPGSGLAVLHGAGHFSFLDQPVVFRRIMESYFKIGNGNE
ncbi:MAG: alpha/beta hydrolase [Lachnospiraceae bacterium]|nr:alpha/beta hydrolase [Lachnospiraceae bacterium]